MPFIDTLEWVGKLIDGAGVFVIVAGIAIATARFARAALRDWGLAFVAYRQGIGRSILLGLEFLVAADIIRTVAIAPTLENAFTLGVIVLIRTFLSIALEVELEGHWPWQRHRLSASETERSP